MADIKFLGWDCACARAFGREPRLWISVFGAESCRLCLSDTEFPPEAVWQCVHCGELYSDEDKDYAEREAANCDHRQGVKHDLAS